MEWTENDMELLKEWLQYNAERYKVDGELKCKFEKLAADGKAEYESRLESLRRKDLNNTRVKIENGLDRIEFVSKLFSHKMMLPQNIATEVSVKLNTVPTMMLTKALSRPLASGRKAISWAGPVSSTFAIIWSRSGSMTASARSSKRLT